MIEQISDVVLFKEGSDKTLLTDTEEWYKSLAGKDEWDICGARIQDIANAQLFNKITQLNIASLKLRWNQQCKIIKIIEYVSFPHLKELFLNGNNVQTLESLSSIYIPHLMVLNLKENNLVSLKSIRKCNFPSMIEISICSWMLNIDKNLLRSPELITQLNCPELQSFWLNTQLQQLFPQSIEWVFKMQSQKLSSFYVSNQDRVGSWKRCIRQPLRNKNKLIKTKYQLTDDYRLTWL